MTTTKRLTYKEGISRIDEALEKSFWLEASWITYAMFEDRCDSLLEKSGGAIPPPPHGFVSINKKIKKLKSRATSDPLLSKVSGLFGLLGEVHDWKERRNPIMHNMVELPRDWADINADARKLAEDGRELLGRFSTAAMKVRRKHIRSGK